MWSGIKNPICYLSAEFGIDSDLPTYSGGLGILAGDIINSAADINYPFIGIGILYKGKGFIQHITADGKMETRDSQFDHDASFLRQTTINGKPVIVDISLGETNIAVKSYHIRLADNTVLFFLSTDLDTNPSEWVHDMDALYQGDTASQIRQQILLGVGGYKLLNALAINPKIYHLNEGRPSFVIWEMVKHAVLTKHVGFEEAWQTAKSKIVYTNHTLVAAGNLVYPIEAVKSRAQEFVQGTDIDANLLIKDGVTNDGNFSITKYAISVSKKQSAVSKVHAQKAVEDWPSVNWLAITNGVHAPSWQDSDFRRKLTDSELWHLHQKKKTELLETVIQRTGIGYDPTRLVVTWARRLAEYKQPKIIFSDLARLKKIVTNPSRPIQLIFAGNSHTADMQAKPLIEDVIKIFSQELVGHAIFVPNYNIALANHLTSGSDVWLNTPKGNLEACGTSGMKAALNGVINATVLDGWTYEVDWQNKGFVLDSNNVAQNFYQTLEENIAPLFYERDADNLPTKWLAFMKNSMQLTVSYNAVRTLEDYKKMLYEDTA